MYREDSPLSISPLSLEHFKSINHLTLQAHQFLSSLLIIPLWRFIASLLKVLVLFIPHLTDFGLHVLELLHLKVFNWVSLSLFLLYEMVLLLKLPNIGHLIMEVVFRLDSEELHFFSQTFRPLKGFPHLLTSMRVFTVSLSQKKGLPGNFGTVRIVLHTHFIL